MSNYLAIDLGAESGRVIFGTLKGGKLTMKEIHRFANGAITATICSSNVTGNWFNADNSSLFRCSLGLFAMYASMAELLEDRRMSTYAANSPSTPTTGCECVKNDSAIRTTTMLPKGVST